MFSDCETPDLPENAKQIVCQKSTCGFICKIDDVEFDHVDFGEFVDLAIFILVINLEP